MTVRPFRIATPQPVLDRIAAQLNDVRIGYRPDIDDPWAYGMDAGYLRELIDYWRRDYDWRAQEAALNRWPQFIANIAGVDIHFYHIAGDGARPLPIILTHGWPGSVVEFQAVIPRLVAAGFTIVVPSLPGFGWSGRPPRPIGPKGIADLWRTLMTDVLGYSRFIAQGGDWGSAVTVQLGCNHADVIAGIHLNFFFGPPAGSGADNALKAYWASVAAVQAAESGFHVEQATKPQTIGLALHDNPVGWAAWVVEKFWRWGDIRGDIESRFSKDQLITNLMAYLVTDSVISSMWIYHGGLHQPRSRGPVTVATGLALYPAEFYPLPSRALAQRQFNIIAWTEHPAGGHFPAMEVPQIFADDLIAFASAIV